MTHSWEEWCAAVREEADYCTQYLEARARLRRLPVVLLFALLGALVTP